MGTYAQDCHDGFPPTIIAAIDALTLWGMAARAEELFGYWLAHFVREDGSINYYGPSVSEYGMLLTTWPDDFKLTFWRDPGANGGEHADVWRDVDTKLAPGQRYAEPQPAAQFFGYRGEKDGLLALAATIRTATRTGWQAFGVEKRR